MPGFQAILLVFLAASLQSACGRALSENERDQARKRLNPVYNGQTGRLERLASDSHHDGRIDTWAYMDGNRLLRVEIDEDGDGRPDRFEYYAADTAPGQPPMLSRVETASNGDGRLSRWEFYERGVLQRVEVDTDADGRPDKWEAYTNGVLATVSLDLEHRGAPTRRFVYRADGTIDHVDPVPAGDAGSHE